MVEFSLVLGRTELTLMKRWVDLTIVRVKHGHHCGLKISLVS